MNNFLNSKRDKNSLSILINTSLSTIVKILSLLLGLLTTPAYITYLDDNEILGLWFTILSILQWILYFDMGIGNGLRNKLVKPLLNNDMDEVKKYVSSAYIFLFKISIIIVVIIAVLFQFVNFNTIFNIDTKIIDTNLLRQVFLILTISTVLTFILRLITSILYAMQLAFIPSLLSFLTNLFLFIYVSASNFFELNNGILSLAIAYLVCSNAPLIIMTIVVFSTKLKMAKPKLAFYKKEYAIGVLKIGFVFLWTQLMSLILNNTNSYLISYLLGNTYVVEYQLYYKIFSVLGMFMGLLTTAVWSTVTKAKEENDYIWINKAFNRILKLGALAMSAEFLIVIFLQLIFNIWLQENAIKVNYVNAVLFAIMGGVLIWSSIISNFCSGLGLLKCAVICLTFGAIINVPLAVIFTKLTNSYISIIIANIFSYIPYLILNTIYIKKHIKK